MKIKLSKSQWEQMGKKAGWMGKTAMIDWNRGSNVIAELFALQQKANQDAEFSRNYRTQQQYFQEMSRYNQELQTILNSAIQDINSEFGLPIQRPHSISNNPSVLQIEQ